MSVLMRSVRNVPVEVSTSATMRLFGPDGRGMVTRVPELLHARGAQVTETAQYVDPVERRFFQRLSLDTAVFGTQAAAERAIAEAARDAGVDYQLRFAHQQPRVALFVSKFDHCLFDLLLRHRAGELACAIEVIVSNHPDLAYIAQQFGIEFVVVPKGAQHDKRAAEAWEHKLLAARSIDLIVLARYMQILSDDFVSRWEQRIINIHHSFLPAFIGGKPYHQAHERGVKLVGATAHYATATLDEGPIIEQDVVRCTHKDGVEEMVRRGRDLEKLVLARAVRWHLEDRVLVYGNKTIVFE